MKPRLLDLYCGAGGAGMGYNLAGFDVVGVDVNRQPYYPFEFIQADALALDLAFLKSFDAIHALPPCQKFTTKPSTYGRARVHFHDHKDLIGETRAMLQATGKPWIIENVEGAPIRVDVRLCGLMFDLPIVKHRIFEANFPIFSLVPPCNHSGAYDPWSGPGRTADKFRAAQGTPWIPMNGGASRRRGETGDLSNAIPPAYTRHLGGLLLAELRARAA